MKAITKDDVKIINAEKFPEVIKKGVFFNFHTWTDVYPGVITEIVNERTIVVETLDHIADKSKPLGMGHNEWIIFRSEHPETIVFTKRKDGRWVQKGRTVKNGYRGAFSKAPHYYYDWSF